MKYKISVGSETFKKLEALHKKIKDANKAANELVSRLGGKARARRRDKLCGGIDAIQFENSPEGWKCVDKSQDLYFPKAANKVLIAEIKELPVVDVDELNEIVGFDGPQFASRDGKEYYVETVQVSFGRSYMVMSVSRGCKYKPLKDIEEILESEYERLFNKIHKKKSTI